MITNNKVYNETAIHAPEKFSGVAVFVLCLAWLPLALLRALRDTYWRRVSKKSKTYIEYIWYKVYLLYSSYSHLQHYCTRSPPAFKTV